MEENIPKSQIPIKKKRAGTAKSRNGCLTCKIRRVKCDEVKPTCTRCANGLRNCAWKEDAKHIVKPKGLLPKHSAPVIPQPHNTPFSNNLEWRYYEMYAGETATDLAGAYKSTFWSQILLQAAHHHPFIRNAVIAIGTFAALAKLSHEHSRILPDYGVKPVTMEEFALVHYRRFVTGIKHHLAREEQTTRLTLISCLLVICLEHLQWHHATAVSSVWNGMKLLNDWLRGARSSGNRLAYNSSPNALVVEDGILHQFKIYEVELSWLCDRRPVALHKKLCYEGGQDVREMPEHFKNLGEARLMLDLISQRIHHFILSIRPEKLGVAKFTPSGRGFDNSQMVLDRAESYDPLTLEQEITQKSYSQEIRRWELAFSSLSQATSEDSPQFVGVNLLRIRSSFLPVLLFGELATTEMIFDTFLPNFKDIIRYAKAHFDHAAVQKVDVKGVCSINNGLLRPLHTAVFRCRDRIVRREAMSLMINRPWREGIIISLSSGRIGEYVMEMEEKDVETYEIPLEKRMVFFEVNFDWAENYSTVKCVRGVGEKREVVIKTWEWGKDEMPWCVGRKRELG